MSIESRSNQYGTVFEHWQIKEPLGSGSGGRSMVFRLYREDSPWDTSVLKVVSLVEERGRLEELPEYRRREYDRALEQCRENAKREVQLMSRLRGNTNIVDYQDHKFVNWSDSSGFGCDLLIRMEQLKDLREEIRSGRQFSEKEIRKLGIDICKALSLCHSKNILHRDIKPENIFLNPDGNWKLGDFLDQGHSVVAGTNVCTPEYAAPEQITGGYDTRVDLYSLGLVLYELSNGNRLPFASSGYVLPEEVQKRQMGLPLEKPAGVGDGLAQVILKACAFRPEDRYQSAAEFAAALERCGGSYGTIPANDGPGDSGEGGKKWLLVGILAALAVIALLLAFLLGRLLMDGEAPEKEIPQTSATETVATDPTEPPATAAPETMLPTEPQPTEPPETEPPVVYVTVPLSGCTVLEDSNVQGGTSDVNIGAWEDWQGYLYTEAVKFWVANVGGWSNTEYIVYDIGGQYETLSGTVVAEEKSDSSAEMVIRIYLDGYLAWESPGVWYGSWPEGFTLDVQGVRQVYVECTTASSSFGYCILDADLTGVQP